MVDIMDLLNAMMSINNLQVKQIARDRGINGVDVNTAWISDEGFETAIIDEKGSHPVERYKTKKKAIEGHEKRCEKAKTIKKVLKLGNKIYQVEDCMITIKRKKKTSPSKKK